jgi:hypothetical protein
MWKKGGENPRHLPSLRTVSGLFHTIIANSAMDRIAHNASLIVMTEESYRNTDRRKVTSLNALKSIFRINDDLSYGSVSIRL